MHDRPWLCEDDPWYPVFPLSLKLEAAECPLFVFVSIKQCRSLAEFLAVVTLLSVEGVNLAARSL